jgi:hypothetical protein
MHMPCARQSQRQTTTSLPRTSLSDNVVSDAACDSFPLTNSDQENVATESLDDTWRRHSTSAKWKQLSEANWLSGECDSSPQPTFSPVTAQNPMFTFGARKSSEDSSNDSVNNNPSEKSR